MFLLLWYNSTRRRYKARQLYSCYSSPGKRIPCCSPLAQVLCFRKVQHEVVQYCFFYGWTAFWASCYQNNNTCLFFKNTSLKICIFIGNTKRGSRQIVLLVWPISFIQSIHGSKQCEIICKRGWRVLRKIMLNSNGMILYHCNCFFLQVLQQPLSGQYATWAAACGHPFCTFPSYSRLKSIEGHCIIWQ